MQMSDPRVRLLGKVELILLGAFLVALPLVEAPKNVFLVAYLLTWLTRSLQQGNFGSLSRIWDGLFAALLVVPLLSVALSAPYPHVWKDMGDIACYVFLGWSLARTRLVQRQVLVLIACAVAATLAGIVHGYAVLALDPKRIWLQLNSVGHVNHSALYGAGVAIVAAAFAVYGRSLAPRMRWLASAAALACFGGVVAFASRGAFVAYLFGLAIVALPLVRRLGRRVLLAGVAAAGLAAIVALTAQSLVWLVSQDKNGSSLVQKTIDNLNEVSNSDLTSMRARLARTSVEYWRQRPLLGVGVGNFSAISPAMVEAWVKSRSEVFEPKRYVFSNHAHNVYFNTLAERGALGEVLLVTLGLAWAGLLWLLRPRAETPEVANFAWAFGVAGWSIAYVGGIFNTTLHHEHGMFCVVGLGVFLGSGTCLGAISGLARSR